MSALGETQARITSIGKLKTVVGAMRGIAATHARQADQALAGYRAYAKVIGDGLGQAVSLLPGAATLSANDRPGRTATVAFSAEHGFAGAFSQRVLASLD